VFAKAGANRVREIQTDMMTVSGKMPLPPIQMLGFHYSKYAHVSTDIIMDRNGNFTESKVPVDVFWMDIYWAK